MKFLAQEVVCQAYFIDKECMYTSADHRGKKKYQTPKPVRWPKNELMTWFIHNPLHDAEGKDVAFVLAKLEELRSALLGTKEEEQEVHQQANSFDGWSWKG
jgi:hypothetical protein